MSIDAPQYERLLDTAKKMYMAGKDSTYIELQFAEAGWDDETINRILKDISKLRKSVRRRSGRKSVIFGAATIAVAILFTRLSFTDGSPVVYVLWGLGATGVLTFVKGLATMMGLL